MKPLKPLVIEKILDSLEPVVYVSDMETHELLFTNKKFKSELGYPEDKTFAKDKCWEVIQKGQAGPCPFCTNSRIIDENGQPTHAYTWEFFNEKTHENLKRLESLGTLAGGIAHQFNNALSVITGHLDLMDTKFPETPGLKEHTRKMLHSTLKMTQLTASLLAYARGGKYQTHVFVLSKFIRESLDHFKYELPPGINLITEFSETDHYIQADKAQIQMLLSAILENSFEAINKIGTIKIVCEPEEMDPGELDKLNINLGKKYVCLTIIDDGPGIDSEIKEKIFDPFVTTKAAGRGLGLSAVYGIVKNHKGFITINSQAGKGTSVKVFFPLQPTPGTTVFTPVLHPADQQRTILLIEDEEAVRMVMKMMLERMGHKVLEAATGENALTLIKSYDQKIHLALFDFFLPDMKGDLLYPLLAKARPEMETIVLSGYALTGPVQKILDDGARAFMQKPVTMAALSEQINHYVHG